jgi:hypothetical protein
VGGALSSQFPYHTIREAFVRPFVHSAAIATTAANPSNIQPLYITISDPPTQSEVQQILSRMNDLISALYRAP